jgi:hypothetical protein
LFADLPPDSIGRSILHYTLPIHTMVGAMVGSFNDK